MSSVSAFVIGILLSQSEVPPSYAEAIPEAEPGPHADMRGELAQCVRHWDFFRARRATVWRRLHGIGFESRVGSVVLEIGSPSWLSYQLVAIVDGDQILGLGSESGKLLRVPRALPVALKRAVKGKVPIRGDASLQIQDAPCVFLNIVTQRGLTRAALYAGGKEGDDISQIVDSLVPLAERMESSNSPPAPSDGGSPSPGSGSTR